MSDCSVNRQFGWMDERQTIQTPESSCAPDVWAPGSDQTEPWYIFSGIAVVHFVEVKAAVQSQQLAGTLFRCTHLEERCTWHILRGRIAHTDTAR
jgi:hypothetical protein